MIALSTIHICIIASKNFVRLTSSLPKNAPFAAFHALWTFVVWYNSIRNAPVIAPASIPIIVPMIGIMLKSIPPITAPITVPINECLDTPAVFAPMIVTIHSSASPAIASPAKIKSVLMLIVVDHVIRSYSTAPSNIRKVPPIPTMVSPVPASANMNKMMNAVHSSIMCLMISCLFKNLSGLRVLLFVF